MSASEATSVSDAATETGDGLPSHFHMTESGPAWRPEVLASMRALGIPDEAIELTWPIEPQRGDRQSISLRLIEGDIRQVRLRTGEVVWKQVVWLGRGYYADADKIALFKSGDQDADEDGGGTESKPARGKRKPLREVDSPKGMPVLIAAWRPEGPSDRKATEETWYQLAWSTLPDQAPVEITEAQLNTGECWALFPGTMISAKRDVSLYADLVKAQISAFGIPCGIIQRFTGISQSPSGTSRYCLPDGRMLGASGIIDNRRYPIDGIRLLSGAHADAWEKFAPPNGEIAHNDLQLLTHFCNEVDQAGKLLALICLATRGLVCSIVHLETAVLLLGERATGKTTTVNFVRGITGPCPPEARADSIFYGTTNAGIETRIKPLCDCVAFVDDLHKGAGEADSEHRRAAQMIDTLTRSAADQAEVRQRATRAGYKREGVIVRSLTIMTGEEFDEGIQSTFRRLVCLQYDKNFNSQALIQGWGDYQPILTAAGHAVIRATLRDLDNDMPAFRRRIRELDQEHGDALFEHLSARKPDADTGIIRSVARCYGRALTGASMLDGACTSEHDQPIANALSIVIFDLALAQLDRDMMGGPSSIDREWIVRAIRSALAGSGHLLQINGSPLSIEAGIAEGSLSDFGYGRTGGGWEPRGAWLGNLCDAGASIYFRPEPLQDKLRHRAMAERLAWKWNAQTFPAAMVGLGIATPAGDGRSTWQTRIGGEKTRRLVIPVDLIYPGNSGEDDDASIADTPDQRDESQSPIIATPMAFGQDRSSSAPPGQSKSTTFPDRAPPAAPSPESIARSATIGGGAPQPAAEAPSAAPPVPTVPNSLFLTAEPIATLPPQHEKPFDPLAAPIRHTSKSAARKAACAPAGTGAPLASASPLPAISAFPMAAAGAAPATRPAGAPRATTEAPGAVSPGPASGAPRVAVEAPGAVSPSSTNGAPRAAVETPDVKRWPERIAALDPETLYILASDGSIEHRPLASELRPENASAGRLAAFMVTERITQLWLHRSYAEQLASDALTDDAGLPAEWSFGTRGKRDVWFRARRDRQEIFIIVPHRDEIEAPDASSLVKVVKTFHDNVGFWYRISPPVVFDTMLKALHKHGLEMKGSLTPAEFPEPMRDEIINEIWMRPLSDQERSHKYVHAFDKNGQYLAAMSSLAVGFGEPVYRAETDFNPTIAGYWNARAVLPDSWPHHLPILHGPRKDRDGFAWYVTPTLTLAKQLGAIIEVREAYTFPETHQPLTPAYKRLRDARRATSALKGTALAAVDDMVKSIYTRGIGNLAAQEKRKKEDIVDLYRPDWRQFIRATARANMMRNLIKYDLRPFAIRTDAIYLTSDSDDPSVVANGLPLDPVELNSWKHIGCIPLSSVPDSLFRKETIRNPQRSLDQLNALIKDKRRGA